MVKKRKNKNDNSKRNLIIGVLVVVLLLVIGLNVGKYETSNLRGELRTTGISEEDDYSLGYAEGYNDGILGNPSILDEFDVDDESEEESFFEMMFGFIEGDDPTIMDCEPECGADEECMAGICTIATENIEGGLPEGSSCANNEDCIDSSCIEGICSTGTSCGDDTHCGEGEICDYDFGTYVCVPGCHFSDQCSGETPACDTEAYVCVECSYDNQDACTGETPACNFATNTCVGCSSADPFSSCTLPTPVCDDSINECVRCLPGDTECGPGWYCGDEDNDGVNSCYPDPVVV